MGMKRRIFLLVLLGFFIFVVAVFSRVEQVGLSSGEDICPDVKIPSVSGEFRLPANTFLPSVLRESGITNQDIVDSIMAGLTNAGPNGPNLEQVMYDVGAGHLFFSVTVKGVSQCIDKARNLIDSLKESSLDSCPLKCFGNKGGFSCKNDDANSKTSDNYPSSSDLEYNTGQFDDGTGDCIVRYDYRLLCACYVDPAVLEPVPGPGLPPLGDWLVEEFRKLF